MACPECESEDIEDEDPTCIMCNDCGHCWEAEESDTNTTEVSRFANYCVGQVQDAEAVPKKDKLTALTVDVGDEKPVVVVTNAFKGSADDVLKFIGARKVVVAKIGAIVEMGGEQVTVKKTNVGGKPSFGMICDSVMLGWAGGSAGAAVLLPEDFENGVEPPGAKPDMR